MLEHCFGLKRLGAPWQLIDNARTLITIICRTGHVICNSQVAIRGEVSCVKRFVGLCLVCRLRHVDHLP